MTYTTQQLQAMSEHTVNHALYHKLFQAGVNVPDITPDYCNNPNDIMPLAFERGISLIKTESHEEWQACAGVDIDCGDISYDEYFHDTNPLRAIACLLLMMED